MGILLSLFLMAAVQTTPMPNIELPSMETVRVYDIPLSEELQAYTFELCREKNVDYEMVLALMKVESGYNSKLVSQTNDYGLMQINRVNHKWLREQLGITDFLDAKQSILSEIDAKEKELKKWIAIRLQLKEMTEEEPMIDINSIRRENILLRSILKEMRDEVENIFEKRWLAR